MAHTTRIRFIGQCHVRGHPGIASVEVFPAVAARRLESRRAETRVAVSSGEFYHPLQLSREIDRSIGRADVVVIDVAALIVASALVAIDLNRLPRWVVSVNDRIRHLRHVLHGVFAAYPRAERRVQLIETHARSLAVSALRPLIRRYPRPTLEEYESLLRDAVNRILGAKQRLMLQGPGGFNSDECDPTYSPDTPRIYDEINAMVRRVAETTGVPMVDRMAIGRSHPSLFLGGTSGFSPLGHRVMGEALAEQLLKTGLV